MAYFDTTPLGRIINRFSKDVDVCDNILPGVIQNWLNILFQAIATVVLIVTPIPYFILVLLPFGLLFYGVQRVFIAASRQLKRLESISRSPILSPIVIIACLKSRTVILPSWSESKTFSASIKS